MNKVALTRVKKGIKVKIVEISAGKALALRLSALGLRPGVCITKISAFVLKGPLAIKVGSATIALGHGMAEKILVEAHPEAGK